MYIAVLPADASSGSAGRTLIAMRQDLGKDGTYALALGDEFRTLSDDFDASPAGDAARAAHPDDLQATLIAFIDRTGKENSDSSSSGGSGSSVGSLLVVVLLLLVAAGGAFLVITRRRARRDDADGQSEVGQIDQQDDFVRLGDSILELDVTLGDPSPAAKADYDRAVEAYDRANAFNRRARRAPRTRHSTKASRISPPPASAWRGAASHVSAVVSLVAVTTAPRRCTLWRLRCRRAAGPDGRGQCRARPGGYVGERQAHDADARRLQGQRAGQGFGSSAGQVTGRASRLPASRTARPTVGSGSAFLTGRRVPASCTGTSAARSRT